MRRVRSALVLLAALAPLLLVSPAMARSMAEEIDHLLAFITASPCAFIRNGVSYEGKAAVDHIKDKYEHYRDDIHSAEDFIARAATKSELSGKPYLVQCDADTMPAADWLKKELATFRQQP
jgi:hypothetical protein